MTSLSQGLRDSFWRQGMQAGFKAVYDCIEAFSETDFTDDLRKFSVPTLIVHGDSDQIVPIGASALASVKIIPGARLRGLCARGRPTAFRRPRRTASAPICSPSFKDSEDSVQEHERAC